MNKKTMELFDEILQDVKDGVADGIINKIISNGYPRDIIALNNLIYTQKYAISPIDDTIRIVTTKTYRV